MKLTLLLSFFFGCNLFCSGQSYTISSPDKNILVTCNAEKTVIVSSDNPAGDEPSFDRKTITVPATGKMEITLKKNVGFVASFE